MTDWNPASYTRYAGQRLQPALDLLMRTGALPGGDICDLGCGTGAAASFLKERYPGHVLTGVDSSPAMLDEAGRADVYDRLELGDAGSWQPQFPMALIFSNALLHWLPGHETLLPRLVSFLAPDGMLAVQVPNQNQAQSHRLWHDLAAEHFPGRFDPSGSPSILSGQDYLELLSPLGDVSVWETIYYQTLPPAEAGHPVRLFTISTFARPVLEPFSESEQEVLIAAYDRFIGGAYPVRDDGSVIFPFKRLFFTVRKPQP